jgi:hypothetical protein
MIEPFEISYTENVDYTKRNKISLYIPDIVKKMINFGENEIKEANTFVKGRVILEYYHEPLLATKDYVENFEESKIAKDLYQNLSFVYFSTFIKCMLWYSHIKAVKNAFNYEIQIENYKKLIRNEFACPIVLEINENTLDNVQFKKLYQWLVNRATLNNIDSVNMLLYDVEKPSKKIPHNEIGEKIINSIQNIVYQRFLIFLETERQRNSIKIKVARKNNSESLISNYNRHQLNVIRKELIKLKHINNISLDQFVKCLSGKDIFPHERIHWNTYKYHGYYIFSKICSSFSVKRLNTSVACNKGKFDSNNKPAGEYEELDKVIKI